MEQTDRPAIGRLEKILREAKPYSLDEAVALNSMDKLSGTVVWMDRHERRCMLMLRDGQTMRKVFSIEVDRDIVMSIFAGSRVTFRFVTDERDMYARVTGVCRTQCQPWREIRLSDDIILDNRHICRFGMTSAIGRLMRDYSMTREQVLSEAKKHGYTVEDLDYVYITCPDGEFRVSKTGSPLHLDGHTDDLGAFMDRLTRDVLGIDIDRQPILTAKEESERIARIRAEQEEAQRAAELSALRIHGFTAMVVAEMVALGVPNAAASAAVKRHGVEESLKNGLLPLDSDPAVVAVLLARPLKRLRGMDAAQRIAAMRMLVMAAIRMRGVSRDCAKALVNAYLSGHPEGFGTIDAYQAADTVMDFAETRKPETEIAVSTPGTETVRAMTSPSPPSAVHAHEDSSCKAP